MELKKISCIFKPVKSQNSFLPVDTHDKTMNANTKKWRKVGKCYFFAHLRCWVVRTGMLLAVTKRDMPWKLNFITCGDDDDYD